VNPLKKFDDSMLTIQEAQELMKCSYSTAQRLMAVVRKEMTKEGLLTMQGRVPKERFLKRVGVIA
jgi:hypothetical protein